MSQYRRSMLSVLCTVTTQRTQITQVDQPSDIEVDDSKTSKSTIDFCRKKDFGHK